MAKHANALVVMAKAPLPGAVKTRLVPPLSPEEAADLYRALLLDLLESLGSFRGADRFIAFTPAEAAPLFNDMAPLGFVSFPQRGEDLGKKMSHIFEELFTKGYRNIVLVGSDLPVFPARFLEDAFMALEGSERDLVLGPSRDGGYYLIGMNRYVPQVFQGIPWSSRSVLSATVQKLPALGLAPHFIPAWLDIDTPEDLRYLASLANNLPDRSQRITLGFLNALSAKKIIWSYRREQ